MCLATMIPGAFGAEEIPAKPDKSKAIFWKPVTDACAHGKVSVSAENGHSAFSMQALRVDLRRFEVRAVDAREFAENGKKASVRQMIDRIKAEIVVNGSFFDEKDRPLGLVISKGRELNPLRRADWGVLYICGNKAGLMHSRQWKNRKSNDTAFAIQVGPRIVVDGKPTKLKTQSARRAVICILPGGEEIIVAATDSGMAESNAIARLMAAKREEGGFGCSDAVMMDGGPSAQLEARLNDLSLSVGAQTPVPIGVAFYAKD